MDKGTKIRFTIHNILYEINKMNKTLNNEKIKIKILGIFSDSYKGKKKAIEEIHKKPTIKFKKVIFEFDLPLILMS